MSIAAAWPHCLAFFGTPLVIEPSPGQLSGDAGLLPIRQFDERISLTRALAEALDDPCDPHLTEHTFLGTCLPSLEVTSTPCLKSSPSLICWAH
jgi:hypothetical protein